MTDEFRTRTPFKLRLGGVCAASIPVIIGILLITIPIIALQEPACRSRSNDDTSLICELYWLGGEYLYWLFMLPIILSFIFVAPMVASICVSELKTESSLKWSDIFISSIVNSTKANMWVAIIYNALIFILILIVASGSLEELGIFMVLITVVLSIQLILWLCVTIPLSLICASIFGVIVQPKQQTNPTYSAATNRALADHKADP